MLIRFAICLDTVHKLIIIAWHIGCTSYTNTDITDCDFNNACEERLRNNKLLEKFVKIINDETSSTSREYPHKGFAMASEYAVFPTTRGIRSKAVHTHL